MKLTAILLIFMSGLAFGQKPSASIPVKHFILNKSGVALDGYDPVSYFGSKPFKGKKEFAIKHLQVVYQFSSESNKEIFKKDPDKYIPSYGGWCAYAIGKKSEKVEPDFTNFKIVDGKINLFYKDFFTNTLDDWNKDEASLNKKAILNWEKIVLK